ncbi:MAG: PKD domain-containing protein, partial [Methanospirillum sp.]|uniref:PKD domain-containing protein n=1 Tax=Methanospirillum sp. TaxID=45200 RepID=UPI002375F37A
ESQTEDNKLYPITSWNWDFGNGNSSTNRTPTCTYNTYGVYQVRLRVANACGSDETTLPITVATGICPAVTASFTTEPADLTIIGSNLTVKFTDTSSPSSNITKWVWDYDDGSSTEIINTPGSSRIHTYSRGVYWPTLTVYNGCGKWSVYYKQISVMTNDDCVITPNFNATPTSGYSPLTVEFTDLSSTNRGQITSWYWDFGNGNTSTLQKPPNQTYIYGGYGSKAFTVNLTVTNSCGAIQSTSEEITILCPPVTADFTPNLTSGRLPLTVKFTDNSTGRNTTAISDIRGWTWNFGDDNSSYSYTSTPANPPDHTFTKIGVFPVNLTVTNYCGNIDQITQYINVTCQNIIASFDETPTSGYAPLPVSFSDTSSGGNITQWQWDFNDSTFLNGTDATACTKPNHTYSLPGNYTVNLTVWNDCLNSNSTLGRVITVLCPIPTVDFIPNMTSGKRPLVVNFSDNSTGANITTWNWQFGDDNSTYSYYNNTGSHNPPDHLYTTTGTYPVNLSITNFCGNTNQTTKYITVTCEQITADFNETPTSGYVPLRVNFTDTSSGGNITRWQWDLGDRNTSTNKNPNNTYYSPGNYTVNLTAWNDCLNSASATKNVTVLCPLPTASFSYTITDYQDFTVQFTDTSTSDPIEIWTWLWDFGDGNTSTKQNPSHEYGGDPTSYTVNLTVTNECGASNKTSRLLNPNCAQITAGMNVSPLTGSPPLTVTFKDNSTPITNITSWRWLFGDGKSYYTTNASVRNTTYIYQNRGTYYATLLVENNCGQAFSQTKIITITNPANISGHLWEDWTLNKAQEYPSERNLNASSGFKVGLWEVTGTGTNLVNLTSPDTNGNYSFNFAVANGIYQIIEQPPTGQTWRSTYPYDSDANVNVSSEKLLIMSTRNYSNINFGNAEWHKSNVTVPLCFKYNPGGKWANQCTATLNFDYRTSFDNAVYTLRKSGSNLIPDVNYSAWGRSNFTLIPEVYNIYFKDGTSGFYFLSWWQYNSVNVSLNRNLTIPDSTYYDRSKLTYWFPGGSSVYFVISQPQENEVIPYSSTSYIEAHYVGPYEDRTNNAGGCYLRYVNTTSVNQRLPYRASWGYNNGTWDNTPYEGKTVKLVVNDTLTNGVIVSTNRNVTVDWELITTAISKISSETGTNLQNNKGIVTVNATVTGKNRDASNVTLLINGTDAGKMTLLTNTTTISTYSITFDAEKFAGQTIPIAVRAAYQPVIGKSITSVSRTITLESKKLLIANFTADPWSGPAPLEVAFWDNSSGGATSWSWNFGDNTSSSLQNPIKTFANQSLFNVTLQVSNATYGPVSVTKQINVTGKLHDVMFYTTRPGSLMKGGRMQWITSGSGQYQVVNNTTYTFANLDTIRNTLPESLTSARILVSGGISELNLTNVTLSTNGIINATGNSSVISASTIKNFHSTLNLTTTANKTALVTLVWDGVYQSYNWRNDITIYNLMTTNSSTMELNMSSGETFFMGRATEYSN